MWKCLSLCIVLTLCRDAGGAIGDQMAQVIQECCDSGSRHARQHPGEGCNIPRAPADVPGQFGTLCVLAQTQCCNDYFTKKENCDQGIDVALKTGKCGKKKDTSNTCCDSCKRGTAAGLKGGAAACLTDTRRSTAEDLLTDDAFVKCCQIAVKEGAPKYSTKPKFIPSLCEEYAPNELCAHHCIAVPGSYRCECEEGFMLMADGRNCREIEQNHCKEHNPCQHKCIDNGKQAVCSCRRGYELMADGKSCQDIDECKLNIQVCLPGTTCSNVQGSYHCIPNKPKDNGKGECPPGFARNLRNNACDDINECKLPRPPCPVPHCSNTIGGYKCDGRPGDPVDLAAARASDDRCPSGFVIGRTGECEDVDECAILKDDCNRLSQFCVNKHGGFFCQNMASKNCQPGFKIDAVTGRCEDINECVEDPEVCRADQICINQLGQYDCQIRASKASSFGNCPDGMRFNPDTLACDDVDECVEGTHLCDQHQKCLNTNGSFECHCKLGFELDPTTGACVDVNECATKRHDCLPNSQRCDNTVGSYLCIRITSCGTGYILQHSTGNCEDVDECALGTHNCKFAGSQYECMNIPGSFRCVKKKVSTTTPEPEYEYIYYDDSEEENDTATNTNNTVISPSSEIPINTTTPPPPTTEIVTTPEVIIKDIPDEPSVPEIHERNPQENIPDHKPEENTIPPPEDKREDTPDNERKPIDYIPEVPKYVAPLYPETTPIPARETNYENQPDIVYKPNERTTQKENPDSTYYETKPEKPVSSNEIPDEPKPTEREPDIKDHDSNLPWPTYSPFRPTNKPGEPQTVLVNVGEETATVTGVQKQDGSVVVDTKDVPKNEWTGIKVEPAECPFGFEASDTGGCFDIDECETNRHSCSGITELCRNTNGGYLCDCAVGFRRDLVTGVCDLIITSTSTTSIAPPPVFYTTEKTTTKDYFYGYLPDERPAVTRPFVARRPCDAGFNLNARTGECEDLDECTNGQANCAAVEVCVNTRGGYRCECPPRWALDEERHRCVPLRDREKFPHGYMNVPAAPPVEPPTTKHVDPELTAVVDREPVLKCPLGYRLGYDNTCVDVDECATGEAKCGYNQICSNLPGGYSCSCPRGLALVADHRCRDVDECALAGNQTICSRNAKCVNTVGSFKCQCHAGFRAAPANDKVCLDIDECTESRGGSLCQHRCINLWGGYRCACHKGYRLGADNKTCVDIDECTEAKIPCVGKCVNTQGSYRCDCPVGYRLSEDKKSCIDIDECETNEATCQVEMFSGTSHVCFNTRGSYRCHRIACPQGYELENKHRCTKSVKQCGPGDFACAHQPTTISYNFITFVSNLYVPNDSVKLFTMRGPAWPFTALTFQLRLVAVDAPPNVKERADISAFLLTQSGHEGVIALVHPLQGPQTIELELSMELYTKEQFGGIALAKIFIYVSEYEF